MVQASLASLPALHLPEASEAMTAQFDKNGDLWIELTDGKLPPHLLGCIDLFRIEHGEPHRVMINLTAYMATVIDARAR